MGASVRQEGKYQSMAAPTPPSASRMAGNVVTIPSELERDLDPRQRYRGMGEQPLVGYTTATETGEAQQPAAQPMPQMGTGRTRFLGQAKQGMA